MEHDKATVNNVVRKITTEPKALILYWLSQKSGPISVRDIKDGISEDFNLDSDYFHCLDGKLIHGYLFRSLSPILDVQDIKNNRSGPGIAKGYAINTEGNPHFSNLQQIAGHALYASATLSELFEEPISLDQIFYGAHGENDSTAGSPGRVASLLSSFDDVEQLNVADLARSLDSSVLEALFYLRRLEKDDFVEIYEPDPTVYKLSSSDDLEQILESNRSKLKMKKRTNLKEDYREQAKTCAEQVVDFLKNQRDYASTFDDIHENLEYQLYDGQTSNYSRIWLEHTLSKMVGLKIIERIGQGRFATAETIEKGEQVVQYLINPILEAIGGNTSLLVTPTNKHIQTAIGNYEKVKHTH